MSRRDVDGLRRGGGAPQAGHVPYPMDRLPLDIPYQRETYIRRLVRSRAVTQQQAADCAGPGVCPAGAPYSRPPRPPSRPPAPARPPAPTRQPAGETLSNFPVAPLTRAVTAARAVTRLRGRRRPKAETADSTPTSSRGLRSTTLPRRLARDFERELRQAPSLGGMVDVSNIDQDWDDVFKSFDTKRLRSPMVNSSWLPERAQTAPTSGRTPCRKANRSPGDDGVPACCQGSPSDKTIAPCCQKDPGRSGGQKPPCCKKTPPPPCCRKRAGSDDVSNVIDSLLEQEELELKEAMGNLAKEQSLRRHALEAQLPGNLILQKVAVPEAIGPLSYKMNWVTPE